MNNPNLFFNIGAFFAVLGMALMLSAQLSKLKDAVKGKQKSYIHIEISAFCFSLAAIVIRFTLVKT